MESAALVFIQAMMMGPKGKMVDPADALPGRDIEMMVTDKHYVLGNPIKGTPEVRRLCIVYPGVFFRTVLHIVFVYRVPRCVLLC